LCPWGDAFGVAYAYGVIHSDASGVAYAFSIAHGGFYS